MARLGVNDSVHLMQWSLMRGNERENPAKHDGKTVTNLNCRLRSTVLTKQNVRREI